jgi:hypothetical protein
MTQLINTAFPERDALALCESFSSWVTDDFGRWCQFSISRNFALENRSYISPKHQWLATSPETSERRRPSQTSSPLGEPQTTRTQITCSLHTHIRKHTRQHADTHICVHLRMCAHSEQIKRFGTVQTSEEQVHVSDEHFMLLNNVPPPCRSCRMQICDVEWCLSEFSHIFLCEWQIYNTRQSSKRMLRFTSTEYHIFWLQTRSTALLPTHSMLYI